LLLAKETMVTTASTSHCGYIFILSVASKLTSSINYLDSKILNYKVKLRY